MGKEKRGSKGLQPLHSPRRYLFWPWHTFPHAASTAQISCQTAALSSPSSFWGPGGRAARLNSPL